MADDPPSDSDEPRHRPSNHARDGWMGPDVVMDPDPAIDPPFDSPRWVVREAPFGTHRFYAMKVRTHRRLPNTVEVVGRNKFDVTDDIEHYIRQYGGTPPSEANHE